MKKWIVILLILVLAVVGGVIYKKNLSTEKSVAHKEIKKNADNVIFGIGAVGAENIYKIGSQMGGKVLKIFTDTGKWVKKGELIISIDMVDLPQQLAQNEALLKKDYTEVGIAKQSLKTLKPKLNLYKITFKRYSSLYKKGYAAKVEYDNAKTNLDTVISQIKEARLKVKSSEDEVLRIKKLILSIKTRMKRYSIYSPVNGYVVAKDISENENVVPTQPIVEIVKPEDVWVRAYIDESLSGKIKVGEQAIIKLRSQPNKKLKGYVDRIEPLSDKVTEERVVDVKFNTTPEPFYLNEQAEVFINTAGKE